MPTMYQNKFWGWYAFFVAVLCATVLIPALVIDQGGKHEWNHSQPVPQGVTLLTKSAYLVSSDVGIEAGDICKGGSSKQSEPDYQSVNVPRLDSVFVQCAQSQTWNDHRELSPNYGTGILRTFVNPGWFIPLGVLFVLCSLPPWIAWTRYKNNLRRQRKEYRVTAEQKKNLLTDRWAKGEITDLEFETKLEKVMRDADAS